MRYSTAVAFRQALEARMLAHSRATGLSLDRLRKTVIFERFLARLLIAAPGRWHLKGGFALQLRFGARARTTRDIDLGRMGGTDEATADFLAATQLKLTDHFILAIERTELLDGVPEGTSARYRVAANLAGRRFEEVTVDVGFTSAPPAITETLPTSDLLAFADQAAVYLPVIPLTLHVAEKLHAYTRRYGVEERPSSRVKDLVDLIIVSKNASLQANELHEALQMTFGERRAPPIPDSLPRPPMEWRIPFRRLAVAVGIESDLAAGYATAAAFLDPVLGFDVTDTSTWDSAQHTWLGPV